MEDEFYGVLQADKGFINIQLPTGMNNTYKIKATKEVWKQLTELRLRDKFNIKGIGFLSIKTITYTHFENRIVFNCRLDEDVPFL